MSHSTYAPLGTNSQQAAAASASARARASRGICPECGFRSVERLAPTLARPLDPKGFCRIGCIKCSYKDLVVTREWEACR